MLTLVLAALLSSPPPSPRAIACEQRLEDIVDARHALRDLQDSERQLRRRFARAETRLQRRATQRLLVPISSQARALEVELDLQERAYIRCVEAELDHRRASDMSFTTPQ